jgi:hypothetical protein
MKCSETLATKLHTPEKNPKENILLSKHDENLKSRRMIVLCNYGIAIIFRVSLSEKRLYFLILVLAVLIDEGV